MSETIIFERLWSRNRSLLWSLRSRNLSQDDSVVCRQLGRAEGGLHRADNMRRRLHPRGAGDAVRPVPQEEAAASEGPASAPAASRPLGVVQEAPAARLRGTGRAVRERRQCLMVALSVIAFVVTSFPPPPPPAIYYSYRVTRHAFLILSTSVGLFISVT